MTAINSELNLVNTFLWNPFPCISTFSKNEFETAICTITNIYLILNILMSWQKQLQKSFVSVGMGVICQIRNKHSEAICILAVFVMFIQKWYLGKIKILF